jgi:pimeloyl-ACP methyl ester carboxylesterase
MPGVAAPSSVFLLVHGSAHGGWCWRRVVDRLGQFGHRVLTPTLTGLGERAHLLTPDVNLDTHCRDILNVIEAEELDDVILVGHSYAGIIISMVADRMAERLRHLVYLDAQVPQDGESWADRQPEIAIDRIRTALNYSAERGLRTPVMPFTPPFDTARSLGVTDEADIAWVNRRVTDHPLATYLQPVRLKHPVGNGVARVYVSCTGVTLPLFDKAKRQLSTDPEWQFLTLDACHDCMITQPSAVARIFEDVAAQCR